MARKKRTKAERSAAAKKAWEKRRAGKSFATVVAAMPTSALLTVRQTTHGDFEANAVISQKLKELTRLHSVGYRDPVQREALDMIALKLSRILSGDGKFRDHWDDIAGYATLVSKHLGE